MKTAVSLPDAVFAAAEELASRLGMTRSGLYAAAIAEYVAGHADSCVTEALDSVYGEEASELDDVWLGAQAEAIIGEDW